MQSSKKLECVDETETESDTEEESQVLPQFKFKDLPFAINSICERYIEADEKRKRGENVSARLEVGAPELDYGSDDDFVDRNLFIENGIDYETFGKKKKKTLKRRKRGSITFEHVEKSKKKMKEKQKSRKNKLIGGSIEHEEEKENVREHGLVVDEKDKSKNLTHKNNLSNGASVQNDLGVHESDQHDSCSEKPKYDQVKDEHDDYKYDVGKECTKRADSEEIDAHKCSAGIDMTKYDGRDANVRCSKLETGNNTTEEHDGRHLNHVRNLDSHSLLQKNDQFHTSDKGESGDTLTRSVKEYAHSQGRKRKRRSTITYEHHVKIQKAAAAQNKHRRMSMGTQT